MAFSSYQDLKNGKTTKKSSKSSFSNYGTLKKAVSPNMEATKAYLTQRDEQQRRNDLLINAQRGAEEARVEAERAANNPLAKAGEFIYGGGLKEVGKDIARGVVRTGLTLVDLINQRPVAKMTRPEQPNSIQGVKVFGEEVESPIAVLERKQQEGTLNGKEMAGLLGDASLEVLTTFVAPARALKFLKGSGLLKNVARGGLEGAAIGGGFGFTGGLSEGQNGKELAKSTAIGASVGLGVGAGIPLAGGITRGLTKTATKIVDKSVLNKTVRKIEKEIGNLDITEIALVEKGMKDGAKTEDIINGLKNAKEPVKKVEETGQAQQGSDLAVVQRINPETNEMQFFTIKKGDAEKFAAEIDTDAKRRNGWDYHVTSNATLEKMEARGFKNMGEAKLEDLVPKKAADPLIQEARKGEYLYHGTNEDVLENISNEGLKPGRRGQLSLSKTEEYSRSFAKDGMTPQGKTSGVMLRVKGGTLDGKTTIKRADGKPRPMADQLNEVLTKETIPPEQLEIYKNGKWQPLVKENPLTQEARKYKSAEEFVKAVATYQESKLDKFKKAILEIEKKYPSKVPGSAEAYDKNVVTFTNSMPKSLKEKFLKDIEGVDSAEMAGDIASDVSLKGRDFYNSVIRENIQTKSQLTDIWNKANRDGVPPIKKTGEMPKVELPEKKTSEFAKRLNEDLPENFKIDEEYNVAHIKDELDKASDLIMKDKKKALQIAMSKEGSNANTQTATSIMLAEKAKDAGDWETVAKLYNSRRIANTRRGQEIAMEKASVKMNPEETYMKEVVNARLNGVKLGMADVAEALKKKPKAERVLEKVKKETENLKKEINKAAKLEKAQKIFNDLICK